MSENIKPYNQEESKTSQVEKMFDNIASSYDFLNHAMTLNIDKIWRKKAIKIIKKQNPSYILDVATGTGDFAINLSQNIPSAQIKAIDLSEKMLEVAIQKVNKLNLNQKISLEKQDCMNLNIEENSFEAASVSFGVRNFENILSGIKEIFRVLKTSGILVVLELGEPDNIIIRKIFDIYFHHILPFFASKISKENSAYKYLPKSVEQFPSGKKFIEIMQKAGFRDCYYKNLFFGVAKIYVGKK